MKRKELIVLAVIVLFCLMLTACGNSDVSYHGQKSDNGDVSAVYVNHI